jgi:hypothetical protein
VAGGSRSPSQFYHARAMMAVPVVQDEEERFGGFLCEAGEYSESSET